LGKECKLNILRKLFPRSLEEAASYGSASGIHRYLRSNPTQETKDKAFLASVKGRSVDIARILFEHGANINARDANGDSALHYAYAWPTPQYSAVQWLVANGADVNARRRECNSICYSVRYLCLAGAKRTFDGTIRAHWH